jgi:hypothetical protein
MSASDVEAQKALARGLKEDLVGLFPQLKNLNDREGALIELENQLRKHVIQQGNRLPGGGTHGMAVAAELGTGHPGAAALTLAHSALMNPSVRSQLAIALRRSVNVARMARRATPFAVQAGKDVAQQPTTQPPFAHGGTIIDRQPTRAQVLARLR